MKELYRSADKIYIYSLSDPQTKLVRYVGKTNHPSTRFSTHLRSSCKQRTEKEKWIYSLLKSGSRPIFDVIEVCSQETWEDRERYWIAFYGEQLTNIADGGHGPKPKAPPMPGAGITNVEIKPSPIVDDGIQVQRTVDYFPIAKMPMPTNLQEIRQDAKITIYWIDQIQVIK